MNKKEIILKVSQHSGIDEDTCEKVLKALEDVLGDELGHSKGGRDAFDKVYKLMGFFKEK